MPTVLLARAITLCLVAVAVQVASPSALAEPQGTADPWAQIRPVPDASTEPAEQDAAAPDPTAQEPPALDPSAFDPSVLALPIEIPPTPSVSPPTRAAKLQDPAFTSRKDNKDGSSLVTVGTNIPIDWQTKVGVDLGLVPASSLQPAPVEMLSSGSSTQDGSSGAAWAALSVPGSPVPLAWDKTSVDARVDPVHEQSRLGTVLSRTVPLGSDMSMTVQNGYAVTQALTNLPPIQQPFDPLAVPPRPSPGAANAPPVAQIWSNEDAIRLSLASTGTTFSVGAKSQSTDDRWLRSLSAEQKLFDWPVSITGAVTERSAGDASKSIMAGFKQAW